MKRTIIKALSRWKDEKPRKPIILHGARQVGKTYILQAFGKTDFPHFHYLNFERDDRLGVLFEKDLSPARILEELQFYLNTSIDKTRDLVIFDEIQQCPRALTALKYFCEQTPELALCAAGSLLGVNLTDVSFPVGKVTFLDLYPMTFMEFLTGIGKERLVDLLQSHDLSQPFPEIAHEQLWEMWKHYLIVGGLPEAVKTYRDKLSNSYEAMQAVRTIQRDLLETYLADIAKHSGKTNALHLQRLWRNVTQQLARAQDGSAPKFRFKDAIPGVRGYERLASPLDWLENARLVLRSSIVERAKIPLAGFASENRFKQYFLDVGLLGAMSDRNLHCCLCLQNVLAAANKPAICRDFRTPLFVVRDTIWLGRDLFDAPVLLNRLCERIFRCPAKLLAVAHFLLAAQWPSAASRLAPFCSGSRSECRSVGRQILSRSATCKT